MSQQMAVKNLFSPTVLIGRKT